MRRFIIADTETTGLYIENGDRIVELCALELIDEKLTGRKFHSYFNPEKTVSEGAYNVHKLSNEFLSDKPLFKDKVQELLVFIGESDIVFHNKLFDLKMLNNELKLCGLAPIPYIRFIDTMDLAEGVFETPRTSLNELCEKFGIDTSHRVKHSAEMDATLLSKVFVKFFGILLKGLNDKNI